MTQENMLRDIQIGVAKIRDGPLFFDEAGIGGAGVGVGYPLGHEFFFSSVGYA